jgi:hypothetical protein
VKTASINREEFVGQLSDCKLLEEDSTPLNYFKIVK